MKKILVAMILSLAASVPAMAEEFAGSDGMMTTLLEPVTFLRCRLARPVMDAGLGVVLQRERVGSQTAAIVTRFFLGRSAQLAFGELSQRPEIIEGDMAVGTIYESSSNGHTFRLAVHFFHADGNGVSPSTLLIDGTRYDLLCQSLMTIN